MIITFLGGGNMASALIGGLLKEGLRASNLKVIEVVAEARERLTRDFRTICFEAATADALECDALVLAVKPQQMRDALADISGRLNDQLVISIAAGLRLADLSRWLRGHRRLVRAMPNSPALIGTGISGLFADPSVSEIQKRQAEEILGAVGGTVWVTDETLMDVVTAVSGSGPAYVFYFIEALRRAALELGLEPETATRLSLDTFLGASQLAAQSREDLAVLRERVASKGGTTEAALRSMEEGRIQEAIVRAVRAAHTRGCELGQMLAEE